jgi:hypothetical protein
MNIALTPEIEQALTAEASRQKTTPELLALDCLRTRFVPPADVPTNGNATLADYLVGHLGVLSSSEVVPGGARLSEECGKKFATGLERKRQQGQL